MQDTSGPQPGNTLAFVSGVLGVTFGLAVGRFTSLYLLIPVVLGLLFGWPFAKLARGSRKPLAGAFGVHAGQTVWVLFFVISSMPDVHWLFVLDLVVLGLGALWILVVPSVLPLIVLTVYQLIMLVVNCINRGQYPIVQDWTATALSTQIVVRLAALLILAFAIRAYQKMATAERSLSPLATH